MTGASHRLMVADALNGAIRSRPPRGEPDYAGAPPRPRPAGAWRRRAGRRLRFGPTSAAARGGTSPRPGERSTSPTNTACGRRSRWPGHGTAAVQPAMVVRRRRCVRDAAARLGRGVEPAAPACRTSQSDRCRRSPARLHTAPRRAHQSSSSRGQRGSGAPLGRMLASEVLPRRRSRTNTSGRRCGHVARDCSPPRRRPRRVRSPRSTATGCRRSPGGLPSSRRPA